MDAGDDTNQKLGGNTSGLIKRMDYPGIDAIDQVKGVQEGNVKVTGSIVSFRPLCSLANHLGDYADAEVTERSNVTPVIMGNRSCWDSLLANGWK